MRLLNGLSDGFLHWVGGTTLASTGTRTLKWEKKTWNEKRKQIFIGGGKVVISYSGRGGTGQIITKPDPVPNSIRVLKKKNWTQPIPDFHIPIPVPIGMGDSKNPWNCHS